MSGVAEQLKTSRKRIGMTQEQIASVLGVSRNYIAQIEMGKKIPSLRLLIRIAEVIKCDVHILIQGDPTLCEIRDKFRSDAQEVLQDLANSSHLS